MKNQKNILVYIFINNGISLEEFDNKKSKIESSLNISIRKTKYGNSKNRILIFVHSSKYEYSNILTWDSSYLVNDDFTIILGESLLEQVSIDLSRTPHMLIGGASGSGKSILLKLILMQSIQKKAKIYIADFKGGVDFSRARHEKCSLVLDESNLLITLDTIVNELEKRKNLFFLNEVSNIKDYNAIGNNLPRIIFACDEIAEVLDKTGLIKEQKEIIFKIESLISIIARQGRAFGIHLILSTQRPDANILSDQIKSNINYRICGRADSILSSIILDNTNASKYVSNDSQGRFINQNDIVFQSYWFDEKNI